MTIVMKESFIIIRLKLMSDHVVLPLVFDCKVSPGQTLRTYLFVFSERIELILFCFKKVGRSVKI